MNIKRADGWWWPAHEKHMLEWMANSKNRIMLNGRPAYQGKKQMAVLKHCKGRDGLYVDIGAHIGLWAYNLAPQFAFTHAFEPVAVHRACFERNVMDQSDPEIVALHACAMGDAEGTCTIETTNGSSGDSQVRPGTEIPMRTLDSFNFDDVDLIKVDCEGFEEKALRGGVETIKRCRPVICVEQKRDMARRFGLEPQGAVRFLQELGYSVAEEIGGDYIMVPA